jgi:hypothetical protein
LLQGRPSRRIAADSEGAVGPKGPISDARERANAVRRGDENRREERVLAGTILRKPARRKLTAGKFVGVYLSLFLSRPDADETKIASLARFGAYEVRLIEFTLETCGDASLLWVELFAHDTRLSLDSFECDDLDEAIGRADEFAARAQALHERS